MNTVPTKHNPKPEERDERVSVPLDPQQFIEGLLAVDPDEDASTSDELGSDAD